MRFALDERQAQLVAEVDAVLDAAAPDATSRERLTLLGERRLLAVHYPERFGGRGLRLADHAVIAERIGDHGLADDVHLVTVQGVGCTLLVAGTDAQREMWLPRFACGQAFASLLLSELRGGTDLTAMETRATPSGDGYSIRGEKSWNLHADWSDVGLCAAKTRHDDAPPFESVTLFLVPLDASGVTLRPGKRAMGEPYFSVSLDDVRVGRAAIVGSEHRGLALLLRAVGFERAGFDYLARAKRWLGAAAALVARLDAAARARAQPELLRREHEIETARALAFRAVNAADGVELDEVLCAYSKQASAEAAQAIAWWGAEALLPAWPHDAPLEPVQTLRRAVAEAPELSVSGGATELQLDLIATELRLGDPS
jgi:alkylation response protein AidB-like acyl-CoA dehydrogenase